MSAARIAIVGAGASGLAAAHALRRRGYRHVTVLERDRRVGGKCCTIVREGRTYELGAGLVTPAYRNVLAWMREVGVHVRPHLGGVLVNLRGARRSQLSSAMSCGRWLRLAPEMARLGAELRRRHRRLFEPGFDGVSEELAQPFDDWCRARRFEAWRDVVEPWVTGFGYGFLSEVPAAYVLKYAALFRFPQLEIPRDGYGGFLEKAARALDGVDLRLGATITHVVRSPRGVTLRTNDEPLAFDALILACPLDEALAFLDTTPDEEELFARIRYQSYYVLGASVDAPALRERYSFIPEHFGRASIGQPVFAYHRWAAADTIFFYGFARDTNWESSARADVAATVERLGGRMREVTAARRWRYFPHVQTADMADGFYHRLEALQGQRRTYYCGEILAFATVETVVDYARALVRRYFGDGTLQAA